MSEVKIGQLIEDPDAPREATHVALLPVIATEDLFPGQRVVFMPGGYPYVKGTLDITVWTGIVDPFLTKNVKEGERFYLWMRPGSVNSLRHNWSHPAVPDDDVQVIHDTDDSCRGCYE